MLSYVSGGSGPGSGIWVMKGRTGTGSTDLRFIPGKLYHLLFGKLVGLPFAKDKHFVQGLVNKYFPTSMGRQNAVLVFAPNIVIRRVDHFVTENVLRIVQVEFVYGERATLSVKIGWSGLGTALDYNILSGLTFGSDTCTGIAYGKCCGMFCVCCATTDEFSNFRPEHEEVGRRVYFYYYILSVLWSGMKVRVLMSLLV